MSIYCHVTLMLMVLPSQALESIFTCMNMTEECPVASEWNDNTKQFKCLGAWRYVCMLGKGSVLLEGCMPNKSILVGTHGCPFVEACDKDLPFSPGGWPILSDKGFIPCESLERCPGQNHTVSVFNIKYFSECLTPKKRKISTVPFSVITYDATSTTRDNLSETNVGNGNTSTVVLSVVLPVVIIALLVGVGVLFCYIYRRGKIACARKDPEEQAHPLEVFLEEKKKQDDSQVDPESKDLKESEAESTSAASSVDQMPLQRDGFEEHQDIEIQTFLASPGGDTTENESTSMENTLVVRNEEFDCKSLCEEDDKEKEYTQVEVSAQWNHYCMRVTQSNTGCEVKCEEQAESYCDTCRLKNLYCKICGIKHSKNHKDHGVIPKINFGQRCNVHKGVPLSRWCSECKYLCFECLRTHRCEGQLQNLKVRLDTLIKLMATKNESIKLKADFKDKDFKHLMDKRDILVSKMETLAQNDYKQLLFANMRDRNAVENQIMELMDKIRSNEAAMKEQCLNLLEGLVLVDIDTVGEWRETYAAISHPLQTLK